MDDVYVATFFTIILQWDGLIPSSSIYFLFVSPGHVSYAIFVVTADIFGSVYRETAAV